jgi:hypothetical protein
MRVCTPLVGARLLRRFVLDKACPSLALALLSRHKMWIGLLKLATALPGMSRNHSADHHGKVRERSGFVGQRNHPGFSGARLWSEWIHMRFDRVAHLVTLALRGGPLSRDPPMRRQGTKPRVDVVDHRGTNANAYIGAHQPRQLVRNSRGTRKMVVLRDRVVHVLACFDDFGMLQKICNEVMHVDEALPRGVALGFLR